MTPLNHPAATGVPTTLVEQLAADRCVIDPSTGEIVPLAAASNDAVVAWRLAADKLAAVARGLRDAIDTELVARTSETGGPITTEYGVARQSVSRGTVSGAAAETIRRVLENAARLGDVSVDAVDNVVPLEPRCTPMRVARWVADNRHRLAEDDYHAIMAALPAERRTVRVEES